MELSESRISYSISIFILLSKKQVATIMVNILRQRLFSYFVFKLNLPRTYKDEMQFIRLPDPASRFVMIEYNFDKPYGIIYSRYGRARPS